jgi:O-antigen ligase
MTLILKNAGIYLAFSLFLAVVFFKFGVLFIIIATVVLAFVLLVIVFARRFQVSAPAVLIYLYLLFGTANALLGKVGSFFDMAYPLLLPFFPLLLIHYFNTKRKWLPGSIPFFIMLSGFLISIIYQTFVNNGVYEYLISGDRQLIFVLSFFFTVYILFSFRILSLWKVVLVLSVSILPEIILVLGLYVSTNSIGNIFHERFGYSVDFTSNQIAVWLDIAFPLALFIALYDKRPRLKIFYSVLSLIYGAIVLLTASRGSLIGLPLVPILVAVRAKSIRTKLIILAISLTALGVFGRGSIARTIQPSRPDILSNYGRQLLLKSGVFLLKANHYFFGIGIDNFRIVKNSYNFSGAFDRKSNMSTHNGFLEVWLGWGFLGLVGWLAFLGQGIVRAARARLRPEISYLKPALLLAISLSLIHGLFDNVIAFFPFMIFFVSLIACAYFLGESDDMRQSLINDGILPNGI